MTYREWLASFEHDDHGKAAEAALNDLGRLNERARGLLFPILREAILMERRKQANAVERSVPIDRIFNGETTLDQRTRRLEQTFVLGDGRRVSWAHATVEEHRQRIEFLQVHVRGVMDTIARHEEAIEAIVAAGVSCLAEIAAIRSEVAA